MPNFIPYLILAAISIIALSILLFQKRAAWLLILLLSFSGMIYVFEFSIFVWQNSYSYFPHIVGISYYDNVLGAVVSNLLAVPVAATYVAVFRLSWLWIVCLAFAFGGIEWTFLQLGIYEHDWWRTVYTILALILFFRFARQWPIWLSGRNHAIMFITLAMFTWSIVGTLVYSLALTGIRIFHIGLFEDPYHDDIFFSALYGFFKAIVLTGGVTASRLQWKRAASLLVIFAAHIVLMRLGILKIMLPLWQYCLIYFPCCFTVLWLVSVSSHKLERFSADT
jgi:hypothetical protein